MDAEPTAPAPGTMARRGGVALLVVALAASASALYLWRELATLRDADHARERRELDAAAADRSVLRDQLDAQRHELERLAAAQAAGETELAGLRGSAGRSQLARAEVLHLLRMANESLHLAGDTERADAALAAAEERLGELSDPASTAARAQVARERAALAALPRADLAGIALTLQRLAGEASHLPLRIQLGDPAGADAAAATASEEPEGAWDAIGARLLALRDLLVKVKRAPGTVEPLLAPQEEFFLRHNLELKLESARLAALQRDEAAFQGAVRDARDWTLRWFDPRSPAVREAVRDLEGLQRVRLAPPLPDISGSTALLLRAGGGAR